MDIAAHVDAFAERVLDRGEMARQAARVNLPAARFRAVGESVAVLGHVERQIRVRDTPCT